MNIRRSFFSTAAPARASGQCPPVVHPACDQSIAEATPPTAAAPRPRLVLAACILASSLAFIDGSVVNVGLPTIGRRLGADAAAMQWVVNAYLLPLSALLLLGGGRR